MAGSEGEGRRRRGCRRRSELLVFSSRSREQQGQGLLPSAAAAAAAAAPAAAREAAELFELFFLPAPGAALVIGLDRRGGEVIAGVVADLGARRDRGAGLCGEIRRDLLDSFTRRGDGDQGRRRLRFAEGRLFYFLGVVASPCPPAAGLGRRRRRRPFCSPFWARCDSHSGKRGALQEDGREAVARRLACRGLRRGARGVGPRPQPGGRRSFSLRRRRFLFFFLGCCSRRCPGLRVARRRLARVRLDRRCIFVPFFDHQEDGGGGRGGEGCCFCGGGGSGRSGSRSRSFLCCCSR